MSAGLPPSLHVSLSDCLLFQSLSFSVSLALLQNRTVPQILSLFLSLSRPLSFSFSDCLSRLWSSSRDVSKRQGYQEKPWASGQEARSGAQGQLSTGTGGD